MNKVYKVIWSGARNAYVVVSEMAKSMGSKSCSTKKLLAMLLATGVMTCAGVAPVMAANPAPTDAKIEIGKDAKATGSDSVAVGLNSTASGIWSVAVGDQANATNQNAVAVGHGTTASGLDSIAIGSQVTASGSDSIVIGNASTASGTYSVAVGDDIKSTGLGGTAMGQQAHATGDWSTAIGALTNVDSENLGRVAGKQSTAIGAYSGAWGDYSTATGMFAKAEGQYATAVGYASAANAYRSTAIGDFSNASAEKSVALGAGSVADRAAGVTGYGAPSGAANSSTWTSTSGAVSVGSEAGGVTRQITNVAAGSADTDAVNVAQLKAASAQSIDNSIRINNLSSRVNKVGAGAAALAALHPMDFDPDDKWSFAAGYGNYAGENAAAVGAYYRPDEKVMFSVGGTVGNGENMVNAGVSFALDRTNRVSNSRTAMAREIVDLRAEVAELKAMVAKGGLGSIDEDKLKLFPDVPENHWAYEYIAKLAGNGILEGYPDGSFDGDRMMSRYEFAAMLYRAMQNGAQLDSKIINEFAPEMGRIRVDRISGKDGDRSKIERVRVNGPKTERDHYGSKLAK